MAKPTATQPVIACLQTLVIVLAGLWIYAPALQGSWIWDDLRFIPDNPYLNDPARLWKIWFQPQGFIEYYPIEATVQWAQWILWQNDTFGYHLTNVVLHLVSAFLVWRLLGKLGVRYAWLGALLFTVHPIMVESVAWIVELKNTLSLPPLLIAMCLHLDYDANRRPRVYLLTWFVFLIAMLCKSSGMMFPFVVLLHAWWRRGRIDAHDLRAAAGFLVITIALGAVNVWINHVNAGPVGTLVPASWEHRLATIGWLPIFYIYKSFVPIHLLPVYPSGIVAFHGIINLCPWIFLGGIIFLAWTNRAAWGRHALLGLGFYLVNLVPVVVFILMNYPSMIWSMDHMVYISMIGLFGLAAAAFGYIDRLHATADRLIVKGLVAVAVISLGIGSHFQAGLYLNRQTLWTYTIRYFPDAVPALSDLSIIALQAGHADVALHYAQRAADVAPDADASHLNLGAVLVKLGRFPEARDQYAAAVKLNPKNADARNSLAQSLAHGGQYADAMRELDEALKLRPDFPSALAARGEIKRSLGDLPGALADLDRAIALQPDASSPYLSRGVIRQANGEKSGALGDLRHFRQLAPTDPNADYAALWIWIIGHEQNHGADADRELTAALAQGWNAAPNDWVSRHALFLLGGTSEAAYLAAQPPEPGRQCEARYYAGIKRLLAGDKAGAAVDFRACLATGDKDYFEFALAQGELNALSAR